MLAELSCGDRSVAAPDASWLARHYLNEPQVARNEALAEFQGTLAPDCPSCEHPVPIRCATARSPLSTVISGRSTRPVITDVHLAGG